MTDGGSPAHLMATGVLAAFENIYVTLGLHGWGQAEVDSWETPTVARFLGRKSEGFDPVVRGVRDGLRLPSDGMSGSGGASRGRSANTHGRMDPSRVTPRTSDPGVVLYGQDAR